MIPRSKILEQLRETPNVSVLIIGAGINGIGVFRDLALNGVDVLLIDRGDFCSGASSASSHMAHGGIRYLENGEFRLVREAVRERNRLIENAPHLVKPLPTVVPIFKIFSGILNAPLKFLNLLNRPAERGALVIKIGLMFYDAFTKGQGTVPPHTFDGREQSLKKYPRLNPEIKYTASYYDGQLLSPERLAVELLLDGEAENQNALALNYVSLAGVKDGNLILRDELTQQSFNVQPALIVNAAGPWIDPVNTTLGLSRRYIGGTKGSHLVLDHPELRAAIGANEFFFENNDGRIVLIFPFYDKVIIGASDIPIENADDARCTDDEIAYFLGMVARVFPGIHVSREQIVFRFSGVRPLPYTHAKTTGQITRDHIIHADRYGDIPVYSLVGGKWTTYRAFAGQVADRLLAALGRSRSAQTESLPIGGGRNYPLTEKAQGEFVQKVAAETGLDVSHMQQLFERYGTRAAQVAAFMQAGADAPLASSSGYTCREVEYLVEREKAVHLDDLLLRRSTLAWLGEVTLPLVDELAGIMAVSLGWTEEQTKAEAQRALDILRDRHGVSLR
ncbi:MAG: glycerol-3-phosphate dehydrogenase/oxidase [Anaerolineales bacterium]